MKFQYRGHIGGGLRNSGVHHHVVGDPAADPLLLGAFGQASTHMVLVVAEAPQALRLDLG